MRWFYYFITIITHQTALYRIEYTKVSRNGYGGHSGRPVPTLKVSSKVKHDYFMFWNVTVTKSQTGTSIHTTGQQNATFRSLPRIHAAILFFQDIQHQSRIWFRCCCSCYCRSVQHGLETLPSEYIRRQVGGRYAFNLFRVMSLGILQFRSGVDNLYSYIYMHRYLVTRWELTPPEITASFVIIK